MTYLEVRQKGEAISSFCIGRGRPTQREIGAGEGTRTLDINLGKVALYQLSYTRNKELVE